MEQLELEFGTNIEVGDIVKYQNENYKVRTCSKDWFCACHEKNKSAMIFRYVELGNRVFKE